MGIRLDLDLIEGHFACDSHPKQIKSFDTDINR